MAAVSVSKAIDGSEVPLVSVILPVFNGAITLALAIKSVLNQTYENFEFIIIDDGSADDSLGVINSFSDKRIKLIENKKNLGLSICINNAVKISCGQYIARMDQDDVCFPNRIEKQVKYLIDNPAIDLIGSATLIFNENSDVIGILPVHTNHEDICKSPLTGFHIPHPTWMGKSEWFRNHNYHSSANGAEDQQLLFRHYENSKFACIPEPLLAYREDRRRLSKMFKSRFIFAKSLSKYAWNHNRGIDALKIIIIQCMKFFGDILNVCLKINAMRNTLNEPSNKILHEWQQMVYQYSIKTAN